MCRDHASLVVKCKNFREKLVGRMAPTTGALGGFLQVTTGLEYSGLFRKIVKDTLDTSLPGPPSYFTRRRDGSFMRGYKSLFKMDIFIKTIGNKILTMNRHIKMRKDSLAWRARGGGWRVHLIQGATMEYAGPDQ
jgi:hypothetical protein